MNWMASLPTAIIVTKIIITNMGKYVYKYIYQLCAMSPNPSTFSIANYSCELCAKITHNLCRLDWSMKA